VKELTKCGPCSGTGKNSSEDSCQYCNGYGHFENTRVIAYGDKDPITLVESLQIWKRYYSDQYYPGRKDQKIAVEISNLIAKVERIQAMKGN
jgi:hypothetical protein